MISAVVLAAGRGTRMKSELPKVLHKLGGSPMIDVVLERVFSVSRQVVVVVGYKAELVKSHVERGWGDRGVLFALQREQLGTAHALSVALPLVEGDVVLVVPGDMPLLEASSLRRAVDAASRADASVLVARLPDPTGYGRVIVEGGCVVRIVEEADAGEEERRINLVNTGAYCFSRRVLEELLPEIGCDNAKGEYYLTDIVELMAKRGYKIVPVEVCPEEGMGVNSRKQLAEAYRVLCSRKVEELMESGVTVLAPETVFVDPKVEVGRDTVIHPFVFLRGSTKVGSGCVIGPFCVITDSVLLDGVEVREHSVVEGAVLEEGVCVGPFARLRPQTVLKKGARVGNFVEVKKSVIGENSKANHLAYIGDATVGRDVNIGAGTITCNYDGVKKHPTVIEDGVFIGSDTQLVAPVRVGAGSLVGAGSTITKDIPPDSLAVTRAPLRVLEGKGMRYFKRKKYGIE